MGQRYEWVTARTTALDYPMQVGLLICIMLPTSYHLYLCVNNAGGALSTGSRVEANILKQWPELQNARFVANCHSSFPTRMESPLCDSSEIQSVADSSCSETPDRGRMNSFFYDGPFPSSLTFKAGPGDKPLHSTRRLKNSLLGLKLGVPSRKNDIGLLDTTP